MRVRREHGISLVEIVVITGVVGVMMAAAAPSLTGVIRGSKADGALANAIGTLRVARDRAIAERRNYEITFVKPDIIEVRRVEIPGPAKTLISETRLEDGLEFLLATGVTDTPDKYGKSTAIAFGSSPSRMFTSEGSFVDNLGDPLNGTLFMSAPHEPNSARAITITGVTALLHGWRWNGQIWTD